MHDKSITRREVLAASAVAFGTCPMAHAQTKAPPRPAPLEPGQLWVPIDPPNKPIGVAKGINPGRVTWAYRPEIGKWDGQTQPLSVDSGTGEWWDDANCDPRIVDEMFSSSIRRLTGKKNDRDAWRALFEHYNQQRNFGKIGYSPGEKITIKANFNNDRSNEKPWPSGRGMPTPQVIHTLLKHLVKYAGVPGEDIVLYDVASDRHISDPVFKRVKEDPDERMHRIVMMCNTRWATNGRVGPRPSELDPIRFAEPKLGFAQVPTAVVDAKYRINLALLRAHNIAGMTLNTKNNFGSIYWPKQNYWGPRPLHEYIRKTNPMGSYSPLVEIMGHNQFGGKGLLYILDGLYSAEQSEVNIIRYLSFGDKWTSSLFMSQDPVAIDSVGLDFLRNEPRATAVSGNPDNFLHEAALAEAPPSGTAYAPSGARLSSLGVHEHWDNAKDKKYSRNLKIGNGIELVSV